MILLDGCEEDIPGMVEAIRREARKENNMKRDYLDRLLGAMKYEKEGDVPECPEYTEREGKECDRWTDSMPPFLFWEIRKAALELLAKVDAAESKAKEIIRESTADPTADIQTAKRLIARRGAAQDILLAMKKARLP